MKFRMKNFYVVVIVLSVLLVKLNGADPITKPNSTTSSQNVTSTNKNADNTPAGSARVVGNPSAKQPNKTPSTDSTSNTANTNIVANPSNASAVGNNNTNQKSGLVSTDKSKNEIEIGGAPKPDENLTGYQGYQPPLGSVLDVNLTNKAGSYTLVFVVSRDFVADVKVLNYPFRLLIDIPMPFDWKADVNKIRNNIPVTVISGFRYGNPAKNIFRIVVDLNRSIAISGSYIRKRTDGNFDFVLNLSLDNVTNSVFANNVIVYGDVNTIRDISKIADTYDNVEKEKRNQLRKYNQMNDYLDVVAYKKPVIEFKNRKFVVFLDPGHGGKDPGGVSPAGTLIEKNLVLEVALKVKERLERNGQIAVVLSRDDDYYVPLGDRVMWAQYFDSSIFVSLHADISANVETSSGMSVYTLSDVASDAQAQMLANNANRSDIIAGIISNEYDEEVNKILISLSQRVKVNESIVLGRDVLSTAGQKVKILQNPLRSAGFAVLKVPNIPSILIELGFLSNPTDVSSFQSEAYKDDMAESIAKGVELYLWNKGSLTKQSNTPSGNIETTP